MADISHLTRHRPHSAPPHNGVFARLGVEHNPLHKERGAARAPASRDPIARGRQVAVPNL
jgi:hypothetical protein